MTDYEVQTIIFDFDGVLVDSGPDIANAANAMLRQLGLPTLPQAQIVGYIGGGAEPLVRRCLGEKGAVHLERALPLFKEEYNQHFFEKTDLYSGARELLARLDGDGVQMAIATNKLEPLTHAILAGLDIASYFRLVVGPESVTRRKPDPEALQIILQHLGTAPARTLMVGDTAADILAGKAAGALTCGVSYGFAPLSEIEEAAPDFIIHTLSELPGYLTQENGGDG